MSIYAPSSVRLPKKKLFSTEQAQRYGVSQQTLSRLTKRGELLRVAHGLFLHPNSTWPLDMEIDWAIAKVIFGPNSYIGGLTALFHYNLIDSPQQAVWVTVSLKTRTTRPRFRLIRTTLSQKHGIETAKHHRIATPTRAVFDALYFTEIWGQSLAFAAARTAITERLINLDELERLAKKLGHQRLIEKYYNLLTFEALGLK